MTWRNNGTPGSRPVGFGGTIVALAVLAALTLDGLGQVYTPPPEAAAEPTRHSVYIPYEHLREVFSSQQSPLLHGGSGAGVRVHEHDPVVALNAHVAGPLVPHEGAAAEEAPRHVAGRRPGLLPTERVEHLARDDLGHGVTVGGGRAAGSEDAEDGNAHEGDRTDRMSSVHGWLLLASRAAGSHGRMLAPSARMRGAESRQTT